MVRVKIKLLDASARLPIRLNDTDACFDCYAVSHVDHGNGLHEYGLGFAMEMPYWARCDALPRSSIWRTGMILSNCVGTIDAGYRGEVKAFFYHVLRDLGPYEVGDRILQIRFESRNAVEFELADELSETQRGAVGFGSTGR